MTKDDAARIQAGQVHIPSFPSPSFPPSPLSPFSIVPVKEGPQTTESNTSSRPKQVMTWAPVVLQPGLRRLEIGMRTQLQRKRARDNPHLEEAIRAMRTREMIKRGNRRMDDANGHRNNVAGANG